MIREARPLAEITAEAIKILYREIGIVDTLRFVSQYTTGHGDYTARREQVFAGMTLDELVSEIKRSRKRNRSKRRKTPRRGGTATGKRASKARTERRKTL